MQYSRSVKQEEIKHFASLSNSWWDESGPWRLLHRINPVRLRYLRDQILSHFCLSSSVPTPLIDCKILDVGCGGGLICEPMARLGAKVVGLDVTPQNIEEARNHARISDLSITYHACALEELEHPEADFDVIIALELLEHVADVPFFLKTCHHFLRPGGLLLLSTLNRTFSSYIFGIFAAEQVLGWVPSGTHHWDQFITPDELKWFLGKSHFQNITFQGLSYSPYRHQWQLSPSTQINYFSCAVKES